MKQCLNCKKDFQEKKWTAKYCSVSCRVMWNRKNRDSKKELTEKQKLNVLYNSFLELIEKQKKEDVKSVVNSFVPTVNDVKPKIVLNRTAAQWLELKRSCETIEEWAELEIQIRNAPNLTKREIQIILTT